MSEHGGTLLWHYVDKWAAAKPDAEAIVFEDRRLTWREFKVAVDRTAMAFLELGVSRGDRIAMVSMARPEFLISFMAAAKVGAIWLGVSPKFSVDEIRYILGHSQPSILITLREYMGVDLVHAGLTFGIEFDSIRGVMVIGECDEESVICYETFTSADRPKYEQPLVERAAEVNPTDEVLLMYTSGSTGKPKGVLQTQQSIIKNIEVEVEHFELQEDGRALLHFPINHVAADVEIGFAAIFAGATTVMMDRFDPQESLEIVEREKITLLGQVPVMYLMQFQLPKFKEMDWSSVQTFAWGGAGAPAILLQVLSSIAAKTGARLSTGYGSTELCGFTTYSMRDDSLELLGKSAGKVVSPFEMKIVGPEREPLPHGQVGEIAFRGPSVMAGYLNNPKATAAVMDEEGWYYTSDLGAMDENGYVYISGRKSEMFKTGGENVFPREVEDALESHPAVLFAAVLGVPDKMYQEVGKAFVMLKPGQTSTEEELRTHAKARLANFKVPKSFDLRPVLPLLPNGKVNKMALRQELEA